MLHAIEGNKLQLEAQWIATTPVPKLSWTEPRVSRYFDVKAHPSMVTQFDIPEPYLVVPYRLRPTDGFYRLFSRDLGLFDKEIARLPTSPMNLAGAAATLKSISGELFPGVLVARVKATIHLEISDLEKTNFENLYTLRHPRKIPLVDRALRMVHYLAEGDQDSSFESTRYRSHYFGLQFKLAAAPSKFEKSIQQVATPIVALLTGTPDPRTLGDEVVTAVAAESEAMNKKSRVEYLILNRQGALYLLPEGIYKGPHTDRFNRTMDLACLAMFSATFFQNIAHGGLNPVYNQFIGEKLDHWIEAPRLVFKSSESNKLTWESLSHSLALKGHLDHWLASLNSDEFREATNRYRAAPPEWWLDREFPQLLETQSEPEDSSTKCIKDNSLREFIMADRLESVRCRITGNYRASVVMAGVAIEAVLLDAVIQSSTLTRAQALKLGFKALIERACPGFANDPQNTQNASRLIKPDTAQLLDGVFRNWRNYVHPGLALRSGDEVRKAAADAAVAALDLLLGELS
ncbi:hypothetical protein [Mycobacterium sp. Aquia_213]|uniref:hypothetical protein n=1 Tax=Mycobacterium sp. Aquia_213 TaxID=2991728 RepID=UPI002270263C|nr:hypothetical protein [Mycobacterium sp. Aquia_213]WAC93480.1 hypothetical protein LMQ14_10285 [Mycobacterium sp. Aquia_213]